MIGRAVLRPLHQLVTYRAAIDKRDVRRAPDAAMGGEGLGALMVVNIR